MSTATLIKKLESRGTGDMRLFLVTPPMSDYDGNTYRYVVVSATVVPFSGPETYIFGSDAEGEISNWLELDGSFRGGLNHEQALRGAGYEVVQ